MRRKILTEIGNVKIVVEDFLSAWEGSGSSFEVCEKLELSSTAKNRRKVANLAARLRAQDVPMKKMRGGNKAIMTKGDYAQMAAWVLANRHRGQ